MTQKDEENLQQGYTIYKGNVFEELEGNTEENVEWTIFHKAMTSVTEALSRKRRDRQK